MPQNSLKSPLDNLREGFRALLSHIKPRKDALEAKLREKQKISSQDECWLDDDANLMEEQMVLNDLEKASDYERGLGRLDAVGKKAVEKLEEWAAKAASAVSQVSKKRKRPENPKPSTKKTKDRLAKKWNTDRKQNSTLAQRIEALNYLHDHGATQQATADHLNRKYPDLQLKQYTISSWVGNKEKWRGEWELKQGTSEKNAKRPRQTQHPEVSEMMDLWVTKACRAGISLTGEVLRTKWTQFADIVGIPQDEQLNLSEGWLTRFKNRHGLREWRRHGEAGSVDPEAVEKERLRIQDLIKKHGYALRDIFNMDETGLFWKMSPDRGLAKDGQSGTKQGKERLTYTFTTNADGSEKLQPFVIGKAWKP